MTTHQHLPPTYSAASFTPSFTGAGAQIYTNEQPSRPFDCNDLPYPRSRLTQSMLNMGLREEDFNPAHTPIISSTTGNMFTFPADTPIDLYFAAKGHWISFANVLRIAASHSNSDIVKFSNKGRPQDVFKQTQTLTHRIQVAAKWAPGHLEWSEMQTEDDVKEWLRQQRAAHNITQRPRKSKQPKYEVDAQNAADAALQPLPQSRKRARPAEVIELSPPTTNAHPTPYYHHGNVCNGNETYATAALPQSPTEQPQCKRAKLAEALAPLLLPLFYQAGIIPAPTGRYKLAAEQTGNADYNLLAELFHGNASAAGNNPAPAPLPNWDGGDAGQDKTGLLDPCLARGATAAGTNPAPAPLPNWDGSDADGQQVQLLAELVDYAAYAGEPEATLEPSKAADDLAEA